MTYGRALHIERILSMNEVIRRILVHGLASIGVLWCSLMISFGPPNIKILNSLFLTAFVLVFVWTWKDPNRDQKKKRG